MLKCIFFIMDAIIKKDYPDFDWKEYKLMNPYLFLNGLRTKEEYTNDFLKYGRYKGRKYKEEQLENYSIHVLLATIGKSSIFNILNCLKNELNEKDYLTIVFDASKENFYEVQDFCFSHIKCKCTIYYEKNNLGYWGHGIRNKHNKLIGDFIYHVDDDDTIIEGSFNKARKILKDKETLYIFKIISEINEVIWKKPEIKLNQISTQSGFIPSSINYKSNWEYKYGGDFDFYNNLKNHTDKILFIDEVIYKKKLKKN